MRILIIKDQRIDDAELNAVLSQFSKIYENNANIKPEFYIESKDYFYYPTYIDSDGDERPTDSWLKAVTTEVKSRYRSYGVDHVVILVHEDNWKSDPAGPDGIWGTNYSNIYHGYQVHYCRWDRDNQANSLGTLHHEVHHSLDALVKVYTGININNVLNVGSFDRDVTHGGSHKWHYIRHKENQASIALIAPYLRTAYKKRKEIHNKEISQLETIVSLLRKVVLLLKQKLNKKDGIIK